MPIEHVLIIAFAGLWAGTINTVVGSGTLVTFPVLVALGYPPVTATTSNAIGLIAGSITGTYGYRHELVGQRDRLIRYGIASFLGACCGAALLLSLPHEVFEAAVPVLIGLAVVLVCVQPLVAKRQRAAPPAWAGPATYLAIFAIGIYGGYFTAAHGVLLIGALGMLLTDSLQRLNAIKNALSAVVNIVAGVIYAFLAPVDWAVVAVLAVSSICGGLLGAKIGRRLPAPVLRGVIVAIGVIAIAYFLLVR